MADLREIAWRAVEPYLYDVSREEYLAGLDAGWTLTPHERAGVLLGVVVSKGDEMHFVTTGARWALTRDDICHYLQPILKQYGRVVTSTMIDDVRQQRFNRLIGFVETGRDEFFVNFELRALSLGRKTCP